MRAYIVVLLRLVVTTGCLFSGGCSSPPLEQREVIGVFTLNRGTEPDVVEFHEDGTYRHTIGPPENPRHENIGKWYIEGDPRERRITLEKFRTLQKDGSLGRTGFWIVEVETRRGTPVLEVDPDTSEAYIKRTR